MSTTTKLAIGFSLASGALLTAWLLTGDRKQKTRNFINKRTDSLKSALKKKEAVPFDDTEAYYV
jgi:hypothetical protein